MSVRRSPSKKRKIKKSDMKKKLRTSTKNVKSTVDKMVEKAKKRADKLNKKNRDDIINKYQKRFSRSEAPLVQSTPDGKKFDKNMAGILALGGLALGSIAYLVGSHPDEVQELFTKSQGDIIVDLFKDNDAVTTSADGNILYVNNDTKYFDMNVITGVIDDIADLPAKIIEDLGDGWEAVYTLNESTSTYESYVTNPNTGTQYY